MRRYLVFFTYIISSVVAMMAISLSPYTRLQLKSEPVTKMSRASDPNKPDPYLPLLLMVEDDDVAQQLLDIGVVIYNGRENILLTSIPRDSIHSVLALPGIIVAESSGEMDACMDRARPFGFVSEAQHMYPSDRFVYDGTGVIVGFTDIGFDNQHIAFHNRVAALYDYDTANNVVRTAETPSHVSRWITDNPDECHATHVANIMAGGYKDAPYYGIATGSKIVAATSRLNDVGILAGIEDVIAYAKRKGSPVVINMSIGNNIGPHDGTSLFCRYLSLCAQDAVLCLSAGNEGNTNAYAYQLLDDSQSLARVAVNTHVRWNGFEVDGVTEIWSRDSTPFDFRIEVYDIDTKEIVYFTPWMSGPEDCSMSIDDNDEQWHQYLSGRIVAEGGISSLNDRYCVAVAYDTTTEPVAIKSDGNYSKYYTALAVKRPEGVDKVFVDFFADAHRSMIGVATRDDSPVITTDGSISDFCTAQGVISVGACNSRNSAPSILYGEKTWDFNVDNVAKFSSYSTRPNFPRLPHFSAPGNYVVSAFSTPYLDEHPDDKGRLAAFSSVDNNIYYWAYECGTSMASPYAAGVIALWLQANPHLTTDEIIQIAQSTAITSYPDIQDPRWGAGCIDARAGMELVMASMPPADADACTSVRVFSLSGIEVDASKPLSPGIYIVSSPGSSPRKVIVN